MSDNENLEEKSGTEELKQKQADHRPLIEKAAEAASDIEKASYKPFAGALDWAGSLVYAVLAMLLLNLYVFRSITVDGESMMNTLQNNDRVLSTNFFYTPSRGDIVVLEADRIPNQATMNYGEPIIKRVIALEGDTIKFDFENGQVFLKKARLSSSCLTRTTSPLRQLQSSTGIPARSMWFRSTACSSWAITETARLTAAALCLEMLTQI